ncbi:sorbitol dehydrogenase family protein [Beijerinckia indica]|uniref:Sorbitol dehydrogenase small subunit n=1 Tax=Beijerinckia indica subsp. indica (strain ATCC 9039 / DSM 1715 / NCIMB 8712) TaxID=395963 RepID=B2ILE1_BEII9|nr:sorbitol dehydrogenase family protein [Beijerinckia indica]ACB97341.1 sorbitol dehydrogenase small subunit [Beijerinckia indica subsp. indica ATCC 9039]
MKSVFERQNRYCPHPLLQSGPPNALKTGPSVQLRRRDVLLASVGSLVAYGIAGAAPSIETATSPDVARFMDISHSLTDRSKLDPRIGAALYAGIVNSAPERKAQLTKLHALMNTGRLTTSADLAKTAEKVDPALKDVIHDIMTGWYRGVADGKVVVYRSALMFDITKDAIYPKTYAAGGPFYWTTQPPEVAQPSGQPVLSPSSFVVEPT